MNFHKNQKFQVTSDDGITFFYTVKLILQDGSVIVHAHNLDKTIAVRKETFRRFLEVVDAKEELLLEILRYKVWLTNQSYYLHDEFKYLSEAIEYGKEKGFEFRVDLGEMACASWSPLGGLRYFTEYQRWAQDQIEML